MKIGIVANVAHHAIMEHIHYGVMGINDDVDGVFVENCFTDVPSGIDVINSCDGARILEGSDEVRAAFYEEAGIVPGIPDTYLYGIIGQHGASDLMEMSVCDRLMVGGVGPKCGMVQGCALPCGPDVYQAFPDLENVISLVQQLDYRGEISIGVKQDFTICSILFGHCTAAFSLFTELAKQNPQLTLEFAFGNHDICKLHETRIAITTLLSYPPYPAANDVPYKIMAPRQADRHLFRFQSGLSELAYASASGDRLYEARRRLRRTLDNCRSYNDSIQYRTDAGKFRRFVFTQDQYKEKGGHA